MRDESGESIIGTSRGCIKVRDIRRFGLASDRWNFESFNKFKGVPWEPTPGHGSIELRAKVSFPSMPIQPSQSEPSRDFHPRRFRIVKRDFQVIGHTPMCGGCKALIRGNAPVNHSELCRSRVERELIRIGDPRVNKSANNLPIPESQTRKQMTTSKMVNRKRRSGFQRQKKTNQQS